MAPCKPLEIAPEASPTPPEEENLMCLPTETAAAPVVLTFDIEEHHRIEAALGLQVEPEIKGTYRDRMCRATEWILGQLAELQIRATFFFLGEIAESNPRLVRTVRQVGHEVASHGWDHRRLHVLSPDDFREDARRSKDTIEQAAGAPVVGFRAPTFSVVRQTAWALDILVELGFLYDSSIYPIYHDRYGIPEAPRWPFLAQGHEHELVEIPLATLRLGGLNIPVGGGGYFRLLPRRLMKLALSISRRDPQCCATVLYFHPWEFDDDQPRLALRGLNAFRTYLGIRRSRARLPWLLSGLPFVRAVDLARQLDEHRESLSRFQIAGLTPEGAKTP
jgi:polysaccharide deacetylase family protein (PEP-CTERM system associated)